MAEPQAPAIQPDAEIPAYSPTGEKVTIAARDADQLIAAGGRVASTRDIQQEKLDAIPAAAKVAHVAMGDPGFWLQGGQFTPEGETFSKGVASGATMGLSDLAGKGVAGAYGGDKLATQYRDTSNAFDAESPMAAKLGEGVGMVAGTIAGGAMGGAIGTSARAMEARQALGLGNLAFAMPSTAIGALGTATENAMARLTAGMLARGALGRAGSTALQWAARGAVEGALMEGMHQTTDDLFQDHDLAAQKILMAGGKGFLTGGAIGGILGGAGSLAKSGLGGLSALRGVSGSIAERAEGQVARSLGEAESTAARAEANSAEALAQATKARNAAAANAGSLESVERTAGESVSAGERKAGAGFFERQANKQAAEALGGGQADIAKAAKNLGVNPGEAQEELGSYLLRKNVIRAGDRAGDLQKTLGAVVDADNAALAALVKKSGASSTHMDELYGIANGIYKQARMDPDVPKKVADIAGESLRNIEDSFLAAGKLKNGGELALDDLNRIRKSIDKLSYDTPLESKAGGTLLHDFRDKIEKLFISKLDEAGAKAATPELRAAYQATKQDVRMGILSEKLVATGAKRETANRAISLTDFTNAGAALVAGGPVAAAGALGLSKLVRQHTNSTAAVLFSRLSQRTAAEAALHTFDDVASRAASGLLKTVGKDAAAEGIAAKNLARNAGRGYAAGAAKAAAKKAAPEADNVISRARTAMDEVKFANDNAVMMARIDQRTGDLKANAPKLAGAMANTMTRAASFLASKMPVETKPYTTLGAPDQKPTIDAVQAAKFLRYKEAVDNPQGCLDRFARGEVRREDCETLKAVAPLAFQQIQLRTQRKLDEARDSGKPIPYEQRLKLSIVLDIQGDASLAPGMIRVMQRNLTTPQDGGTTGPKPSAPRRPMTSIGTQLQGTDKLESS